MNTHLLSSPAIICATILLASSLITSPVLAQTAPPPNLGDETKGAPAIEESTPQTEAPTNPNPNVGGALELEENEVGGQTTSVFGNSTVIESRRESGQVYSIELQHSNAPPQYIEETGSDGNIEFEANDIEKNPNLPKWKLGSW